MVTPLRRGQRQCGTGRVEGAACVADPVVDRPVRLHEPLRCSRVVRTREPDQVEGVAQGFRRQAQQRARHRPRTDRGEHHLAEPAEVCGCVQPVELGAHHGLDGGVADERREPRVRERPPPVGPQRLLQRGEPPEVVEVGHGRRLPQRGVVGQAGQQDAVVGCGAGEALGDVQLEGPPTGRCREDRALHHVEPVVSGQHAANRAPSQPGSGRTTGTAAPPAAPRRSAASPG